MPQRGAVVEYRGVTKRFRGGTVALDDLSLQVPAGTICALVGPSGGGKTTALKVVNRLIEPTAGQVLIDGKDVLREDPVPLRRRVGYVIQQVGLFPHRTIAENVATVPELLGWDRARIRDRVQELLVLVGLDPASYSPPTSAWRASSAPTAGSSASPSSRSATSIFVRSARCARASAWRAPQETRTPCSSTRPAGRRVG